ncbi:hypothetical protein [Spiroplasma chrysopicola]|uniref:Uncharacterized protein n=1 Tax=Spiroplasma chrysopicola DF-1 TaxID=1276227 RepID=R4U3Y8_9MOLU|nr:hypothetical protein [Spiroplasma chrysopicola]AGM25253.1 hypothetical protein SCHRY_v1c06770 [Spiroplasma chrysopicola DF-1]
MKHLLNIFSVLTLATSSTSAILSKDFNVEEQKLSSRASTIDLSAIELKTGDINLFKIKDKLDDEELVTRTILMGLLPYNKDNDAELKVIIASVTRNFDNWIIDLPELPVIEQVVTDTSMTLLYIGSDYAFENYLTIDNLILSNHSLIEKKDLNTVIQKTSFDNLITISETLIIDEIIKENTKYGVKRQDFKITEINYSYAIASATEESNYKGNVAITYKNIFKGLGELESKVVRSDAYNSVREDSDSKVLNVDISLGRDVFLKKYSKMSYKVTGYNWNNHDGTEEFDSSKARKIDYKDLSLFSNDNVLLFNRGHHNVNQMKSWAQLYTRWVSEYKLEIKLTVNTWAYATAWNAQWARVESQIKISELNFF